MKKNTITKVLLLFVMVALMFSLAACGGNKKSGSSSGTKTTPQLGTPQLTESSGTVSWKAIKNAGGYEYIITGTDGVDKDPKTIASNAELKVVLEMGESVKVRATSADETKYKTSEWSEKKTYSAGAAATLTNLVRGLQTFINTLNATTADDTLSANVSIGGFFTGKETSTIALAAKANASIDDPEFMIDFKLNDKAYVTLGYKDNKVYVREPINLINSDATDADAFYMDVTALNPSVESLMTWVMNKVGSTELAIDELMDGVAKVLDGPLGKAVTNLLVIEDKGTSKEIGITVKVLKTAIGMIPTLLEDVDVEEEVDKYIGIANKVLTAFGAEELKYNDTPINWQFVLDTINSAQEAIQKELKAAGIDKQDSVRQSLLKIVANYTSGTLSGIDLVLDLSVLRLEGLDYSAGLNIGLDTFSNSKTVSINPGSAFAKKDLVINLNGALPVKGLNADVKGVVRLSDAFANKNNKWATVVATTNNQVSTGYINANGAYVDFSGLFTLLGVQDQVAKYKVEYKNGAGEGVNLVEEINKAAAKINETSAAAAAPRSWDEFEFDMESVIAGIGAASNKVDYVCNYVYNNILTIIDETVEEKANATQSDIISWAFNYKIADTNSAAKDYALFYNNATTFEGLWENIKAKHALGKDALDAATITGGEGSKLAGIQLLLDGENNDLLDYIAYFVKIPTVTNGEPDFENLVAPNNATALKAWLNWIFPVEKEDHTENEARAIVEDILGMSLDAVIDGGLYLEAVGGTGLAGSVRAAASSEANAQGYVTLGGGIAMEASVSDNMAAIETLTNFNDKDEQEKYIIAEAAKAMLDGLRAYGKQ